MSRTEQALIGTAIGVFIASLIANYAAKRLKSRQQQNIYRLDLFLPAYPHAKTFVCSIADEPVVITVTLEATPPIVVSRGNPLSAFLN